MLRAAVDTIGRICERQNSGVGLGLFVASAVLAVGTRKLSSQSRGVAVRKHWSWLEGEHNFLKDVLGEEALSFVKSRNQHSIAALGDPTASPLYDKVLSILDSSDKIPFLRKINDMYYNFWQDKANPRGLWRRTTMESYMSKNPVWEIVLDFDELGRQEGESWVYKGHIIYEPDYSPDAARRRVTRTMLQLSRGGADAVVLREFDLDAKAFVSDRPFLVPECKSRVAWKSMDTLYIGTDLGDGKSMTDSGYPRVMREWHRGTSLADDSKVVHEGDATDVSAYMYVTKHRQHSYTVKGRRTTFYTSQNSVLMPGPNGEEIWHELKVPADADISIFADQLVVQLRSAWTVGGAGGSASSAPRTFAQGSLVAAGVEDFVRNSTAASFTVLFEPTATVSLDSFAATRDYLILETLDTVKSRYTFWRYNDPADEAADGKGQQARWTCCGAEKNASVRGSSLTAVDSQDSNEYWFTSSSFLQPSTLSIGDAALGPEGVTQTRLLKSLPAQFNAAGLVEQQFLATSADGTKVPYFLIAHKDMPLDGSTPTLLYGYGGFEISLPPVYSGVVGAGWLDTTSTTSTTSGTAGTTACKHRCYVMANIRGGGEFGPAWHQAALRENRKLAYDDFIAVAEDLIARRITQPAKLAIRGGSNGGLLVGNVMVRRPDLFAAVCCAVPLLDMKAYNTLLAGASWMAEYGNPDVPEDWAFLQQYSPYHNIDPEQVRAGAYPALLMTTSTRDDRVHPYHARCFVKRLLDCGTPAVSDKKVFYYENIEGGHGGAADNKQQAYMSTLYLNFLKRVLNAE